MQQFIVYCPDLFYEIRSDTGKRFRQEYEAIAFVRELRKYGHCAWMETEGQAEIFDA